MANLGVRAKLYRGTAGTAATTEMTNVQDVSFPLEWNEVDISDRSSEVELVDVTMKKLSIEWQMKWDEDDEDFDAILTAFVSGDAIALKCLSKANGSGIDADFVITKCSRNEALKDAVRADVVAKPTRKGTTPRSPVWVDASAPQGS